MLTSTFGILNDNSVMSIDSIDTFDLVAMSKYFDHMQIHSSNMNIIDNLIKLGVPSQKIIVKMPLFARLQTTVVELDRDPSYSERSMTYNEMCNFLSDRYGKWAFSYDAINNMNIAKTYSGNIMNVIRYKGSRLIANLVKLTMEKQLGGTMVGIAGDDKNVKCEIEKDTYDDFTLTKAKPEIGTFSLVNVVNDAIIAALDEINQVSKSFFMEMTIENNN